MCGEAISNCACEAFEDDRESLCQMSDSACSLNEGEPSTTTQETWLVQEYCSLGTLQVQLHASACLVNMIVQQSAPDLQPGILQVLQPLSLPCHFRPVATCAKLAAACTVNGQAQSFERAASQYLRKPRML